MAELGGVGLIFIPAPGGPEGPVGSEDPGGPEGPVDVAFPTKRGRASTPVDNVLVGGGPKAPSADSEWYFSIVRGCNFPRRGELSCKWHKVHAK